MEGLFRSFDGQINRNYDDVLNEIVRIMDQKDKKDTDKMFKTLYENALNNKGNGLVKEGGSRKGSGKRGKTGKDDKDGNGKLVMPFGNASQADPDADTRREDEAAAIYYWYITLAKSVSKVSFSPQSELM